MFIHLLAGRRKKRTRSDLVDVFVDRTEESPEAEGLFVAHEVELVWSGDPEPEGSDRHV